MRDAGLFVAGAGFLLLLAYATATKLMPVMRGIHLPLGLLTLPMAGSLLVRLAFDLGWWTVAYFAAAALTWGAVVAILPRDFRSGFLLSIAPVLGLGALASSVLCWLV